MNKTAFRAAWIEALKAFPWASDPTKLANFAASIDRTLAGGQTCMIDGPACIAAWKSIGCKGKPTYKGIHALPG
jgi:hypothetical protein